MTALTSSSPRAIYLIVAIFSIVLTFASGYVIRPHGVQCSAPAHGLCAPVAGFPFAFVQDHPDGSSSMQETAGIDATDYWASDFVGLIANILVYGVLLWGAGWALWRLRHDATHARWRLLMMVALVCVAVVCLVTGGLGYRHTLIMQ